MFPRFTEEGRKVNQAVVDPLHQIAQPANEEAPNIDVLCRRLQA
jgi:hypothetical protein